jgi:NAD(P)-dependent dehydrogenase (short-subunit alcohol dehydrogenase family)
MGEALTMRIFVAGATGVLGTRIVPLLVADGHTVAGLTRSPEKAEYLRSLGAAPVICDVFDSDALMAAVSSFAPTAVMHQLTDLPDRLDELADFGPRNDRMRTEGTRILLAVSRAAGAKHAMAQSIAWRPPGRGGAVDELERPVLAEEGVVVRHGQLYGPGTFYPDEPPAPPRIHVDAAAKATPPLITAPTGIVLVAEDTAGVD